MAENNAVGQKFWKVLNHAECEVYLLAHFKFCYFYEYIELCRYYRNSICT